MFFRLQKFINRLAVAEGLFEFHKAFVLKKLTDGAVLTGQYCSTEPPVFEYWRLSTENSHCPFFVLAQPDVTARCSAMLYEYGDENAQIMPLPTDL